MESLLLFAEILGYESAPRPFAISQHKIFGLLRQRENNQIFFGPVVIYGIIHNILKVIESSIDNYQKDEIDRMHDTAAGKIKADIEGQDVFEYLKKRVIREKGVSGTLVFNC
ncbi:hypothetical protein QUF76_17955 [Desulfobacterales bacterium HSG16]|nr:hypothetical protein [Desulfobacterales bacterium HSG16]